MLTRIMTRVARLALLALVLIVPTHQAAAQAVQTAQPARSAQTSAVNGTVTDPTGAGLPGVTLAIVDPMTGQSRTATAKSRSRVAREVLMP